MSMKEWRIHPRLLWGIIILLFSVSISLSDLLHFKELLKILPRSIPWPWHSGTIIIIIIITTSGIVSAATTLVIHKRITQAYRPHARSTNVIEQLYIHWSSGLISCLLTYPAAVVRRSYDLRSERIPLPKCNVCQSTSVHTRATGELFIHTWRYAKCGYIGYCLFVFLFVRLYGKRIFLPRTKLAASNFVRWFIGVFGRESHILENFAPPEVQNRPANRP